MFNLSIIIKAIEIVVIMKKADMFDRLMFVFFDNGPKRMIMIRQRSNGNKILSILKINPIIPPSKAPCIKANLNGTRSRTTIKIPAKGNENPAIINIIKALTTGAKVKKDKISVINIINPV